MTLGAISTPRMKGIFVNTIDVKIINTIGEQMPRVFRGETTILEHLRAGELLDTYYANALGLPECSKWLAHAVKRIFHRYPHMNIMEVGAGTGGATKSIIKELGSDFSTYLFTDISAAFFESAREKFEYSQRVSFRTFNAEKDPIAQGFEAYSFDLVVASFVLHATSNLEKAMNNIRRLLRPGGYLIVAEITDNDRVTLLLSLGVYEWDTILLNTGFSGLDVVTPDDFRSVHPFSVFVSQAVDDRINFLRFPLNEAVATPPLEHLVIVSGGTLQTLRLANSVRNLLERFSNHISVFQTLQDIDYAALTSESSVLCLSELEKPLFENIDERTFASLKRLLGSKTVVWLTSGRLVDNPLSNITVGFGRTAVREVPELRLQFLDVKSAFKDAFILAEAVLRLQMTSFWTQHDEGARGLLWSIEPELLFDESGHGMIPRFKPLPDANTRYNSASRPVTRHADLTQQSICICRGEGEWILHETDVKQAMENSTGLTLKAVQSILYAVPTPMGHRFISTCMDPNTGEKYLTLTTSLTSAFAACDAVFIPYSTDLLIEADALADISILMLLASVLATMRPGEQLLVHNGKPDLAKSILQQASKSGVNVKFSTTTKELQTPESWAILPLFATKSGLCKLLSDGGEYTGFLGLSDDVYELQSHERVLIDCLPSSCHVVVKGSGFKDAATFKHRSADKLTTDILKQALGHISREVRGAFLNDGLQTITLESLAIKGNVKAAQGSVVHWTSAAPVPVRTQPLDCKVSFKANRTYWLAGLTGSLGRSLCDWMIERGAKHIALTSRDPKIDAAWLESTCRSGATVRYFSCDITKEKELKDVHDQIGEKMPPIAGVAQGAMVLRDTPIRDMTLEQMTEVLAPKVKGSINLDKLFYHTHLDFFIFFSSILGVTGSIGQANYTAANNFMCSLASQRRKRGFAASVISIGVTLGVGYVASQVNKEEEKALARGGMMSLSETDFHQVFAEGVLASHPQHYGNHEISVGLAHQSPNDDIQAPWIADPKFARFVDEEREVELGTGSVGTKFFVKDRLEQATSHEDAVGVIEESLLTRLRALLQLDMTDDQLLAKSTDNIGLDSLIAVDIHSWVRKNLAVDIPVMRWLGGVLLVDIVNEIIERSPLIPITGREVSSESSPGSRATSISDHQTTDISVPPLDSLHSSFFSHK
ncbi:KR domain-containing protein [Xylaria sp. FL0064]|nr:KR domain-containing protein [Xylaria sp. FL0064]